MSEKKKVSGKKVIVIILCVVFALAIVTEGFIKIATKPVDADSDKIIAVGGMVVDDKVDYQSVDTNNLDNNFIVDFMCMVWRFCASGDASKHAKQTPPTGVTELNNLPYVDDGNRYHLLDVYYPEGTEVEEKLPVIVDIHGGGWEYGDKDLNKYYCLELASRGYCVVNISYRLVPDVTVNEQIQDCAQALKWVNDNIADYPADPNNLMLTGDSAGGQLAVYTTLIQSSESLQKTFETVDAGIDPTCLLLTSPVAFMNENSPFGIYTKVMWGNNAKDKATYEYENLDQIIDEGTLPPTYLITSSGDTLAHDQTVKAYDLIKSKGYTTEIADYDKEFEKKQPHVFSVLYPFDEPGQTAIDGALEFYQKTIK